MVNQSDEHNHLDNQNHADTDDRNKVWQLKALSEALGDLTLTVDDSLSVGRGQDNDVVLGSKAVSRNHAVLSVLNGQLYLKDLDSSNGTFINEARIESNQSKLLQDNDSVGFANFIFKVMTSQASQAAQPETTSSLVADSVTSEDTSQPSVTAATTPVASDEPMPAPPSQEPIKKETNIEEVLASAEAAPDKTPAEPVKPEPVKSEPVEPEPVEPEPVEPEPVEPEPVEPEPIKSEPIKSEPIKSEPVASEPVSDTPLVHDQAAHQEAVVSPEHDKTTKTELQEEADPEVLRAKQAATAQFSGTANLGKDRDLGTKGNNAMDQAIRETKSHEQPNKKPSGSWFIWAFIAIIIIALALWLFNMGGGA